MFGNILHWLYTGHWPKWYDTQHINILGADHIRQCCERCERQGTYPLPHIAYRSVIYER